MRDLTHPDIEQYRVHPKNVEFPAREGVFLVHYSNKTAFQQLTVIASNSHGWDHVSVSLQNRMPTWLEMEHVAAIFFEPGEVAMQLHMPRALHINIHPFVLHWWRPHGAAIPLPPREFF